MRRKGISALLWHVSRVPSSTIVGRSTSIHLDEKTNPMPAPPNGLARNHVATLTVENYLKAILMLSVKTADKRVSTGQIASSLGVSPGTVTSMLKTLAESKLATYTPYEGVRLTESGRALALRILRRHRLLELFLVETLRLSWAEVHEEAEHMEHAASDWLVDRIDDFLGHPNVDPHGDPIPRADGTVMQPVSTTLASCRPETRFRLSRVIDQYPDFLRYLTQSGLELGVRGTVVENVSEAGIVTLRIGQREVSLGREAAEKILVETE
jgi:DtxR family Mn-dependent transcriptional regulator